MIRTKRRDFWMRLLLVLVIFLLTVPSILMIDVSLVFSIPVGIITWFGISTMLLSFVGELDSLYRGLGLFYRICFSYSDIEIKEVDEMAVIKERTDWCKENITGFWFMFSGVHYFLTARNAAAFKLTWL